MNGAQKIECFSGRGGGGSTYVHEYSTYSLPHSFVQDQQPVLLLYCKILETDPNSILCCFSTLKNFNCEPKYHQAKKEFVE
jgi:hypothetical protein